MSKSISMTSADALQAYVRDYKEDLFTRLFYGFKTAQLATVEEGVKGERILTNLTVASNLASKWTSTFTGKTDAVSFVPRTLKTILNKAEFSFVPTEFEQNYLGWLRKKGQDPKDFPFEAYILMKLTQKLTQEMEAAVWQAVIPGSPTATDPLIQSFDGFLKIITAAVTALTVTPVATGALTTANIIQKIRDMWASVDPAYQENGTAILMNYANYDKYRIAYKDAYHSSPEVSPVADTNYKGIDFELGGGLTKIIPFAGFGTSNRVIITPLENLVVGVDDPAGIVNWNVEQDHWTMDTFGAFRLGAQYRTIESGVLVVNDQA